MSSISEIIEQTKSAGQREVAPNQFEHFGTLRCLFLSPASQGQDEGISTHPLFVSYNTHRFLYSSTSVFHPRVLRNASRLMTNRNCKLSFSFCSHKLMRHAGVHFMTNAFLKKLKEKFWAINIKVTSSKLQEETTNKVSL